MTENHQDAAAAELPELSDERIDEIESALFARIGRERTDRARGSRRRRGWILGSAAAAAVVVVAIAIAPVVGGFVSVGGADSAAVAPDGTALVEQGAGGDALTDTDAVEGSAVAPEAAPGISPVTAPERQIIASASATVRVDDIAATIRSVATDAEGRGGFVESSSIGSAGVTPVPEGEIYAPTPTDGGWITVRVPADQLSAAIDALSEVGDVEASALNRQDVTAQSIDLQARIDAAQASVERLTALMAQAASVADLLAAETALSERQATLESYQQQLEALDDQVALSSLTVTVVPRVETVTADPAGFGDGLVAGWNGLVAALNGIVVAIGFLLPWVAVVAVAGLIVWGIVRLVRRRRAPRDAAPPAV